MPWKETSEMQERLRFIDSLESGLYTMTELCTRYGISRKTGYKWADRYVQEGVEGLKNQSRAPKRCPHQISQEIREALLVLRRKHPRWGPRKLLGYLKPREPEWCLPAPSTVGDLLRREGLIQPRRRRSKRPSSGPPSPEISGPNAVWATDFKGEFRTRDRQYCYPLTLTDRFSRYLLECRGLRSTATAGARSWMERAFRKYGLPSGIVCDNGTPFGSQALCGLSPAVRSLAKPTGRNSSLLRYQDAKKVHGAGNPIDGVAYTLLEPSSRVSRIQ